MAQGVIADPRLLILDGPSGWPSPILVDRILALANALCASGVAVLLTKQLMEKALRQAHHGCRVETGHIAGEGTHASLRERTPLEEVYLGSHHAAVASAGMARDHPASA